MVRIILFELIKVITMYSNLSSICDLCLDMAPVNPWQNDQKKDSSCKTVMVGVTSNVNVTPEVACCSKSFQGGSTPSKKRKHLTPQERNTCEKCKIIYGSRMDDEFDSVWINCNRRGCDYWVHMYFSVC